MSKTGEKTTCYHCGEDCATEEIRFDDQSFCCHGCKTVYTLLQDTGLTTYYRLENSPGSTVEDPNNSRDFLDLEEVQRQFIDFTEGNRNKVTFYLPAVHCAACIWLLEKLDRVNKGVIRSEVNFLRKELTVYFDADQISLKELVVLLDNLGYPPDLQRGPDERKQNSGSKKLLLKLGVAGFCFGNIMLFSFPEYVSISDASLEEFGALFSYLNLLLALPVLLYADVDYLKSAWRSLRVGYLTIDVPISLGIVTLFGRSAFEVISGTGPGYFDSFAGLIFFLLVGKWFQSRTYEALAFERDFKSYFPMAVSRIKNGQEEVCMLEDIQPGDRLKILNKQVIPADSVLIRGEAVMDYSFVNGESDLVEKSEGELLYAGGRQSGGVIEIEVVKEVSQGYLTRLWNQDVFAKPEDRKAFSGMIDRVSRYFSMGILLIAFGTLAYWLIAQPQEAFNAFTAVLIIACPCALALSMPFATGNVSRILGKLGFFVKNATTLERLATTDAVVFDKTGTLTQSNATHVEFKGRALTNEEKTILRSLAYNSTHPLSVAIRDVLDVGTLQFEMFREWPGKGIMGMVGQYEAGMGSAKLAKEIGLEEPRTEEDEGSRQRSIVHAWINGRHLGYFLVRKQLRPGIDQLVSSLHNDSELHLLSGDNDSERERMQQLFGTGAKLQFEQSPTDKLNYVSQLQEEERSVLMLGDGLNDAGALKQADVGVAVADDVFSFSPACDAIVQANQLQHLHRFLAYIRKSMNVVKASVLVSLMYNVIGLYFAVRGELTPIVAAILMPLSSVTVVVLVSSVTSWIRPRT